MPAGMGRQTAATLDILSVAIEAKIRRIVRTMTIVVCMLCALVCAASLFCSLAHRPRRFVRSLRRAFSSALIQNNLRGDYLGSNKGSKDIFEDFEERTRDPRRHLKMALLAAGRFQQSHWFHRSLG